MRKTIFFGVLLFGALLLSGCGAISSKKMDVVPCISSQGEKMYGTRYGAGYIAGNGVTCAKYETYLAHKDTVPVNTTPPDWGRWCSTPYEVRVHKFGLTYVRQYEPHCFNFHRYSRRASWPYGPSFWW